MTVHDVLVQYEARVLELQTGIAQLRFPHALATAGLTVAIGLFLAIGLMAIRKQVSLLWMPIPIVAFGVVSGQRLTRSRQSRYRMWRLKRFYDKSVQRVTGNWAGKGATGEEFIDSTHVYSTDLHVLGEGSLFELLCIARTSIGRRGLADYLLKATGLDETILRQEAIRELRRRVDLREKVATLGEFEAFESHQYAFDDWLDAPEFPAHRALQFVAAGTSSLVVCLVVAGLMALIPWSTVAFWIAPLIAFHTVVGLYFKSSVERILPWLSAVSTETGVLREGLQIMEREEFQSAKLRQLSEQVRNAPASIRKLERLLGALAQRNKDMFYHVSHLLLIGTQLCMAIERWRAQNGPALKVWLQAWAEFEALNALAGYGYENPENIFPEFSRDGACFEARELGHPLILQDSCVVNDIALSREDQFYIVSGSNMSGKSTLLRAIGLNAVLGFAGAPVRARTFRSSALSVVASLSLVDSLLHGKSKFKAEVDRLRQAIDSTESDRPVLFLVDEIFSGTNSSDRRIAAEAVVRTLVKRGAIGALSTHDLALTEIATSDGMCGVNVHMGSRDGTDPMDFDYRLKPGVNTETNALAIARMAGVPV